MPDVTEAFDCFLNQHPEVQISFEDFRRSLPWNVLVAVQSHSQWQPAAPPASEIAVGTGRDTSTRNKGRLAFVNLALKAGSGRRIPNTLGKAIHSNTMGIIAETTRTPSAQTGTSSKTRGGLGSIAHATGCTLLKLTTHNKTHNTIQ